MTLFHKQWLLLFLLIITPSFAASHKIPRLSPLGAHRDNSAMGSLESIPGSKDLKTYYYDQTLDHFNYRPESYQTFKQRYVINYKYWAGAKARAPILTYLGAEGAIDADVAGVGFMTDNAPRFKALIVYIEHRYYGRSNPLGSMDKSVKNSTIRGYFNSAQAIADYAEVLLYLKKKLSAAYSPIIVVGASYGGMLASWFRLKYPHVAIGAFASSAPILYFDDITPQNGYYSVVTKDFKEASESCYEIISKSWFEINKVASKVNGLSILSKRFKTCAPLNNSSELKDYLDTIYAIAAQYNHPPTYPVTVVCGGIDRAPAGTDVLGRIFAGVVAVLGNSSCYDINEDAYPSETSIGWDWQTCSEMVIPIGRGKNDTMFPAEPFSLKQFTKDCIKSYGISPRAHWVTTYYGGHDIKLVLGRFGSNIIFSNGLRDPYSSGGVLEDISDSILAVYTINGSHCLDIHAGRPTDPQWLVMQRKIEVEIMEGWIKKYYADLLAIKI